MRAVFGVVSLLVVLAIVGVLATKQLRATGQAVSQALPPSSAAAAGNVREQSQQLQQKVRDDVAKAMAAGTAARSDEAEK